MGLSVAISGGIILTVFVLILLSLPGLAEKMFSIGDITTQVTQHEQKIYYSGECLGAIPTAGNWCVQSISNDVADPKILNSGEQASIRTNLSENLASKTAIITLVTDNGVTFTTSP